MLITDLIINECKPLSLKSNPVDALNTIDDFKVSHLPVFEGLTFLGNISETQLFDIDHEIDLKTTRERLNYFFVTENSTVFEAVKVFYTHDCNMIPVLNELEQYLGYIVSDDVLAVLSKMPLISEPAAMLTVTIPERQYSMSEISKIMESNNAKLFGVFVSGYQLDNVEVTVKFNAENLSSVGETFERFGYGIKHRFFNDEKQDLLEDRYQQLMKYLDI